jgi:Restriction endonuclease
MKKIESFEEFKDYIDSLRPIDVEKFVFDIFSASVKFSDVTLNSVVNDRQIDITLTEKSDALIGHESFWFVEIKSYRNLIPVNVIDTFIGKIFDIRQVESNSKFLIISTSGYTKSAIVRAKNLGVFLWGPNELYDLYRNKSIKLATSESPRSSENSEVVSKIDAFKNTLNSIKPGKENWSKYQSLIVDILEFLLCPPLEAPQVELADSDKRNRRDIIFENSSGDGFWRVVRDIYQGHYIVVDAKNYIDPLSKRPVLDISHYLKPYGCGMFSIIVSRKGYGNAGKHAAKEQWIGNGKMIVALSDEDLVKMLDLKRENALPEDIIKKYISSFRISL